MHFTRLDAKLLAGPTARVLGEELMTKGFDKRVEDGIDQLLPGNDIPEELKQPSSLTSPVQATLDYLARVDGELIDKLTDAFAADVAEYRLNAQAYNASVRRWSAELAAMEALARSVEAAHRALASSFWDCNGRLFDDSALQSGNVDLGGAGLRTAIGDPSDLEVPVDVAFTSAR
jgi:hypothetical protein